MHAEAHIPLRYIYLVKDVSATWSRLVGDLVGNVF